MKQSPVCEPAIFFITAAEVSQVQAIVQEIPEVPVVEWIQEQIVETIEVLPQERVKQHTAKQFVHVPVPQIQEQSAVTDLVNPQISITTDGALQVIDSFPLLEDFAAPVYNQVHQEQIVATPQAQVIVQEIPEVYVVERTQEQTVETIEVIPQERFQQCTIAPPMQVVTREQFHNDTEHSPRRKVRFATEDDVQFIAASSRRAEISDITRALAQFRNDIAHLERDGFVVPHFHQQCADLETRIAVFSREKSSSSSPSGPSKKLKLSHT